jgi:hypothetical protein
MGLESYKKKALGTGISLHEGTFGQAVVDSSTRDFDIWLKGALEVECLSLKRLHGDASGGSFFTGDPGRYVKKGSRYGHLSP